MEQFLHGKAYLFGGLPDARVALVTSANLTGAGMRRNLELGLASYEPPIASRAIESVRLVVGAGRSTTSRSWTICSFPTRATRPADDLPAALARAAGAASWARRTAPRDPRTSISPLSARRLRACAGDLRGHGGVVYAERSGHWQDGDRPRLHRGAHERGRRLRARRRSCAARQSDGHERIDQARLPAQVVSFTSWRATSSSCRRRATAGVSAQHEGRLPSRDRRRGPCAAQRGHDVVSSDGAAAPWLAEAGRVALRDADQQRAMGPLQPRDAVRAPRSAPCPHGIDSVRELFISTGANERDPESLSPDVLFPLADAVSVRRDRAFIESEYGGQQSRGRHSCEVPTAAADDRSLRLRRAPSRSARPDRLCDQLSRRWLAIARAHTSSAHVSARPRLSSRAAALRGAEAL